ncbi:isopentenyl-diphosphate delta-isomerase [Cenarchaeum symbiosum A]|uniref:isopentenyl-diphosphate Delta-isomerase n=1 Tax=Cenarchaeum symbiosum (strain A) TaxID=414004 RepID=A0RY18_CENSY|nr:isopentenyl-diphosphate delta-isomerase [Cenarchaeum symbiosum A]
MEMLVLVDKDDSPLGLAEKVSCHLPQGRLHRAFTVLLFDPKGRLLLARRSAGKMLWPGDWDGTVASHPREGEGYVESGRRRLPEEIGADCSLDYAFKFEYHVPYKDIGSENEVCGTLAGIFDGPDPEPSVQEISEVRWASAEELGKAVTEKPAEYCPWMLIALYLLPSSEPAFLAKYAGLLESWTGENMRRTLEGAISAHLPASSWRLVE